VAEIVNLRRARKARARREARTEADANAARHGEAGASRKVREAETARVTRLHEGNRRETDTPDGA
jgi:hypothetical protein